MEEKQKETHVFVSGISAENY